MASLPPVPPTLDPLRSAATINALVREYNRTDRKGPIVGTDTGTGAAYVIAPVPGIVQYEVGQEFEFQAAHANTTTAPTLNVNGVGAGVITDLAGTALVAGDIPANSWVHVVCASTTPTFALLSIQPGAFLRGPRPILSYLTNALTANVTLNNTTAFFTGPSVAQGTTGIWLAMGTVTCTDTSGGANFFALLWDGGAQIVSSPIATSPGANQTAVISVVGVFSNPAGNIRISVKDTTFTSGIMYANASGAGKDSSLTVVRIG